MKDETKSIIKKTLVESMSLMFVLIIIGLSIYLQALIKQDTITLIQAEVIGYTVLGFIISFLILILMYEKAQEIQKRKLIDENEDQKNIIIGLEKELDELKKRD